jgi:hypothetical protein
MTIPGLNKDEFGVVSMPAERGSYVIPNNLTQAALWSGTVVKGVFQAAVLPGCAPGNANMAIMIAHTGLDDKSGVFVNQNTKLKVGDVATLIGVDTAGHHGTLQLRLCAFSPPVEKFKKNGVYDKQAFERALKAAPACARVATATCAGSIDWSIKHHKEIGIVYWDVVSWTPSKGK